MIKLARINENGEYSVPADSFNNQYDFNVQPSPISVNLGGIPGQWTNSQPYSRWDMTTNPIAQTHGRNPVGPAKGNRVKTFDEYLETLNK
jgi:hypothetical protein